MEKKGKLQLRYDDTLKSKRLNLSATLMVEAAEPGNYSEISLKASHAAILIYSLSFTLNLTIMIESLFFKGDLARPGSSTLQKLLHITKLTNLTQITKQAKVKIVKKLASR